MAKRKIDWDENKLKKWIQEGRGQGEGKDYKPWLTVQDFPSKGRVSRVFGWKTKRIHHFFYGFGDTIFLPVGMGG